MAECKDCGTQIGMFTTFGNGLCRKCHIAKIVEKRDRKTQGDKVVDAKLEERLEEKEAIASVVLTTEAVAPFQIVERIDIVTAECAFGMNIFKDLFAGVRDVFGGRSKAVQKTMRDARKTALHELRREAYEIGANAVVGVDLDYVELSGAGNMVMLVASGTAVKARLE
jgi:uncharacterized protein YbjQ (UPF0145 family)